MAKCVGNLRFVPVKAPNDKNNNSNEKKNLFVVELDIEPSDRVCGDLVFRCERFFKEFLNWILLFQKAFLYPFLCNNFT